MYRRCLFLGLILTFFLTSGVNGQPPPDVERLYWMYTQSIYAPVPNVTSVDDLHWLDVQRIGSTNQYLILEGTANFDNPQTTCERVSSDSYTLQVDDHDPIPDNDSTKVNRLINQVDVYLDAFQEGRLPGAVYVPITAVTIPTGCIEQLLPLPPGSGAPEKIFDGFVFTTALDEAAVDAFYAGYFVNSPDWWQLPKTVAETRWRNVTQCTVHLNYHQRTDDLLVQVTSSIEPLPKELITGPGTPVTVILSTISDEIEPHIRLEDAWDSVVDMFAQSTDWREGLPKIAPGQTTDRTAFLTMVSDGETNFILFKEKNDPVRTQIIYLRRDNCNLMPP